MREGSPDFTDSGLFTLFIFLITLTLFFFDGVLSEFDLLRPDIAFGLQPPTDLTEGDLPHSFPTDVVALVLSDAAPEQVSDVCVFDLDTNGVFIVLGEVLLLDSFLATTTSLASSCFTMALFLGDIPIQWPDSCSPTTGVAGMSLKAGPDRGGGRGPSV